MNASKFSALVLFLIILLCLVSDSHSTSRLESHVKLKRNLSNNKVSSKFGNVHYAFKMFNKNLHASIDVETPTGSNPRHNDTPPVNPP